MATPLTTTLMYNLLTLVNSVSIVNGYVTSLSAELLAAKPQTTKDYDARVFHTGAMRAEKEGLRAGDNQHFYYDLMATVLVWLPGDESQTTGITELGDQVAADLHKAVMADPTLSGKAIYTEPGDFETAMDERGLAYVAVDFKIRYRVLRTTPYDS